MTRWLLSAVTALTVTGSAGAAEVPEATRQALADVKLGASVLDGLDAELKVPQAWLDGAAREDEVIILGTWDDRQYRRMAAAFTARYPFVKPHYTRASATTRIMKTLVALREGRVLADVIIDTSTGGGQFRKMGALADLRELPGFANVLSHSAAPDGTSVGYKIVYRCIAFNTNLVKKADLPATWKDLVTSKSLQGGKLALSNRPNTWLFNLWGAYGEKWGTPYLRHLFADLKPQRRKEGLNATLELTVAGEADAVIPATNYRVRQIADKGAPIGYHCPTPVTAASAKIVMLKQAKHAFGARLFINWLLSREGQILQYALTHAVPVHKALQMRELVAYADEILGKPVVVANDELLGGPENRTMMTEWNNHWGR